MEDSSSLNNRGHLITHSQLQKDRHPYKLSTSSFIKRQNPATTSNQLLPTSTLFHHFSAILPSCIPISSCIQFQKSLYQDNPCKFICNLYLQNNISSFGNTVCLSINTLTTRLHCAPLTLIKRNHEEEVQNPLPGMRLLILF